MRCVHTRMMLWKWDWIWEKIVFDIYLIRYTSRHWLNFFIPLSTLFNSMISLCLSPFFYNFNTHNATFFSDRNLLFPIKLVLSGLYCCLGRMSVLLWAWNLHKASLIHSQYNRTPSLKVFFSFNFVCFCSRTALSILHSRPCLTKMETKIKTKETKRRTFQNDSNFVALNTVTSDCFALCAICVPNSPRLFIWRSVTQSHCKKEFSFLFAQTIKQKISPIV